MIKTHQYGHEERNIHKRLITLVIFVIFGMSAIGCATKIVLHKHLYRPNISPGIAEFYSGKTIDLNNFENKDERTRKWAYYSVDNNIKFETSAPLEDYVLDCFRDTMWKAGMSVYKYSPNAAIPDMTLYIDRWTDQEFRFSVTIMKDNVLKFREQFTVTMPYVEKRDNFEQMRINAYEMINKATIAVMSNSEFRAIFR